MIEPFLALQASAGSGKTFALSVRYIALLLKGANPKSITALTFTKKAASEMSERIVATFLNLHTEAKKSELAVLCEMLELNKDEVLARRDEVRDEFLRARLKITTFDAFFTTILRSFALNLGLSPDFENAKNLQNILQKEFIKALSFDEKLLSALACYIVLSQKSQGNFFDTLSMFYENFNQIKTDGFCDFKAQDKALFILNELYEYALKNGASSTVLNSFKVDSVDEIFEKSFLTRDSLDYSTYKKIYSPWMDEKFNELKSALLRYARHMQNYRLNELNRFLDLYKKISLALNAKLNKLSFSDVTKLTNELLTQNFDKEMLYFRLDERITHLLIDEFQDTSVTQYEIIYPLIAEIVAGYGQNGLGSFFYVGDVKQSIYRFRGGKKELFDKILSDFKQVKSANLDTNYRSARNLVEYVNEIFKDKISGYVPAKPKSDEVGYIKVISDDDIIASCVKQVKNLIKNGVRAEEITILCWKNDDIRAICEALNDESIASQDEGGMLLKNSKIVFALINYAKFCLFGDKIYLKNAQKFIENRLEKIELDLNKDAAKNLLFLAKKAGLNLQNLDILKLFLIANKAQNLINFIFEFEDLDELAAQSIAQGVRVMTTHKSKGLEFEHVVLCDRISKAKNDSANFICEYDIARGYEVKMKLKNLEAIDPEYANIKKYAQNLDKQEEINKLYVATTRAKRSLIIIKKSNPNGTNPSYFTKYLSNKTEVCYLDLDELENGEIIPSKEQTKEQKTHTKKIKLLAVPRERNLSTLGDDSKNLGAIYFGLALHYLLEMSAKFEPENIKIASVAMRNKFAKFLDLNTLAQVQKRALNLINEPKFRELIDSAEIKKEQVLNFNGEQKQIDLLCFKESEIVVIDYKSSKFSVEKNIAQVREYVQIISEIYPQMSVRGVIFYILDDGVEALEI